MTEDVKKNTAFIIMTFLLLSAFSGSSQAEDGKIFPTPKQIEMKDFKVDLNRSWGISVCGNDSKIMDIAEYLENVLLKNFDISLGIRGVPDSRAANSFFIGLAGDDKMQRLLKEKGISFPQNLGKEGYLLEVYSDAVIITANAPAGVFYGVQSFIQLISKDDNGRIRIAAASIKDYPISDIRGVYINAANFDRLKDQIEYLAQLKINLVVIENWAFFSLKENDNGAKLTDIFEYARERFVEPVPHLNSFSYAGPILSKDPYTAEGILVQDAHFRFVNDEAMPLGRSRALINVIRCDESDIIVKNAEGDVVYKEGKDYSMVDGPMSYPYPDDNRPAKIVRLQDGKIRDREDVLVSYDYVEKKTASWANWVAPYCPSSERTYKIMSGALEDVIETLHPRYISIGHDEIFGINRDSRCKKRNMSNAEILSEDINKLYECIKNADSDVKVMMWDDMLNPWHNGGVEDMQVQFGGEVGRTSEAIETIPHDIIMLVWWYESADKFGKIKNSPAYFQSKGFDYIVAGYKDKGSIRKWADSVRGKKKCLGIMDTEWEQFENNLDAIKYTADASWN
ncbi:MAG: glycoside hydrolase family 20 zincin-like fold domain-containing protein [Candidatus Omnitrophota bacterium]|jgi:hypothetical protein